MTSQSTRVLSKGEIKDVKEQKNTFSSRSDVEKVEIFGVFILSWVRIELMTSQSLRVLSTGEIKDVKEQENTFCSRSDVEKVEIFWENWIFSFCHE